MTLKFDRKSLLNEESIQLHNLEVQFWGGLYLPKSEDTMTLPFCMLGAWNSVCMRYMLKNTELTLLATAACKFHLKKKH